MDGKSIAYIKSKEHYLKPLLVYLLISLVMFWQVTLNIFGYVVNGHGDVYQTLFNLWWVPYSLFALHQSPYFTSMLYYPIGANLVTQTLTPLAGIFSLPLQWISGAFAYNVLFFSSFALSGLFMYALALYITKNKYAAFIAGLIFAFSPMHIAQSYGGHLDWTIIEWVPLFLYFYIRMFNENKFKYAFLAAVSFVLLTFMGDIEQGIMVFFTTVIFTVLYMILHRNKLLNRASLVNFGYFIAVLVILLLPFILLMYPYLNSGALSVAQENTGVNSSMLWSNNLLSFFLPSYYNGIFHGASLSYYQQIYAMTYHGVSYQLNIGERVSYIGYTVLALMAIALYYDFKHNRTKHVIVWLVLGLICVWLSLGPYLQVYTTVTGIPTLFALYLKVPILNIIREPGRFDMIATLCMAIIAAFGFDYLTKNKNAKDAFKYFAAISVLILIEYNGMSLSSQFANSLIAPTHIPLAYQQIGNIPGNFSVLILPSLANVSNTPAAYTGLATYYVTALKKPIIGGYTSRENGSQYLSVSSIPLSVSSSYLEQGYGLIYPSPIKENVSNLTALWLASEHVAFVSVIRPAYSLNSQEVLYGYLSSIFGSPVYSDNSTFVFSTANSTANAGKSLTAYTLGTWLPGYYFCTTSSCNETFATMWWGNSTRSIAIYSPSDQKVAMYFQTLSLVNGMPLYVYENVNPLAAVKLGQAVSNYTINMTLSSGLNFITFHSQNSTIFNQTQLTYGLRNITLSKV